MNVKRILTKTRRVRLEKLAAKLESLPRGYKHFNMGLFYARGSGGPDVVDYGLNNGGVRGCGTIACALGHGPAAGVPVPRKMIRLFRGGGGSVNWKDYGELFVGPMNAWVPNGTKQHMSRQLDSWLFSGGWSVVDNHHWGAAARIRYVLDTGEVPREFGGTPMRGLRRLYAPYRVAKAVPLKEAA